MNKYLFLCSFTVVFLNFFGNSEFRRFLHSVPLVQQSIALYHSVFLRLFTIHTFYIQSNLLSTHDSVSYKIAIIFFLLVITTEIHT